MGHTETRTPFVPRRLCDRRHVKRSPSLPFSQTINKESATRRELKRSKYNVPPPIYLSLLPARDLRRFLFYAIHHRIEPPPPSSSASPGISLFSNPLAHIQPSRPSALSVLFAPSFSFPLFFLARLFRSFAQLLCIVRTRAFGEILIPLCQLHSRTSRA